MKENEITIEASKILSLSLDIGEHMLRVGGETNRVEDTIIRICKVYEIDRIDVFSIRSLIIATIKTSNEETLTQTRRIYSYGTDLSQLEKLNSLSRYICQTKPSFNEIKEKIQQLLVHEPSIKWSSCLGYILASSGFSIFFGGNLMDAVAAAIIGILIFFIDTFIKRESINQLIYTFVCSIITGLAAILFAKIGIGINVDKIIIGDIMLLIPGIPLINSVRDMLCGDIIAGLLRLTESILIAIAIACGFAISLIILGGILQ
jgi:uncharacterized membrane protein YjjP (DUF1212 family)